MDVKIEPGKYVLAVSGGVDSMVLLDLLAKKPGLELIVAHFNHGIRANSAKDEQFVAEAASRLKVVYVAGYGDLGPDASEEAARQARYRFLTEIKNNKSAGSIITAHHRDDMVETAILNLLRGTGRKGLTAISSNKNIIRPLLGYSKAEIYNYARQNNLKWREDFTNHDNNYLRNYVRNKLMPKLADKQKEAIILNIDKVAEIDKILNPQIAKLSHYIYHDSLIDRSKFSELPIDLGNELIVYWLRQNDMLSYDKKTVNRINNALRTSRGGSVCPVKEDLRVEINIKTARFNNTL